jgi:hypothetical protein
MTRPEISGISPFFIVRDTAASLSFYLDQLGFEITFQEPTDDPFFGIVCRGGAMIMLKSVGVDPLPNYRREPAGTLTFTFLIRMHLRRSLRRATSNFRKHSKTLMTVCVGSSSRTLATCCPSVVLGHEYRSRYAQQCAGDVRRRTHLSETLSGRECESERRRQLQGRPRRRKTW